MHASTPALIDDIVAANHILAHHGILDAFGHVSARSPENPDHFLLSRSMAPALIAAGDIMTMDLDGNAVGEDDRKSYLERHIHGEIYRARPDIMAVVHSHSPSTIPFGVVRDQPLRPIYHMAAGAGATIPVFDIAAAGGDGTDMLVRDTAAGAALAQSLAGNSVVLMRGHGVTVAAATVRFAVFNAYYVELNARLQSEALRLGPVKYLSEREIDAAWQTNSRVIDRAWDLWVKDITEA